MTGKNLLKEKIKNVRRQILDISFERQFFHVGCCLSCVEILVHIFFDAMKKNDRFIFSKGHAGLALYAVLMEKGILDKIDFTKLKTHPEKNLELGIEYTTGSLGQGLSVGCGLALANRKINVYAVLSDGECDEGSTWEAAKIIVDNKVKNLKVIIDANKWQLYRKAEKSDILAKKWKAFGWNVIRMSQENPKMNFNRKVSSPTVFIIDTIKGKGLSFMEDTLESHYIKLTKSQYK